jgi:hypothetical protein
MADDVPDDQCDAGAGERDHVEPVAAYPRLRGQVAVRDLDRALVGAASGQQAALQGEGGVVFAGVAAGVVDADRRAADQLLGQGQVVVLERGGLLGAVEADDPEGHAACSQGHRDQGVDARHQCPFEPCEVLGEPAACLGEDGFEHRPPGLLAARLGCGGDLLDRAAVLRGGRSAPPTTVPRWRSVRVQWLCWSGWRS